MSDAKFCAAAVWTASAGAMLGSGITYGLPGWTVAGAVMSAVCPWGVVAAVLVHRRHR